MSNCSAYWNFYFTARFRHPLGMTIPGLRPGGLSPGRQEYKKKGYQKVSFLFMGWVMGLEPTTPGTTIRCSAN